MNFYFGQFVWFPERECFDGPAGTRQALDFRPLSEQSSPVATQSPRAIFAVPEGVNVGSEYDLIATGSPQEIKSDGRMKSAFASHFGYAPAGDTFAELLLDLFMFGSDPEGLAGHKPIQPGTPERRTGATVWIDLHFVGRQKSVPFEWGKGPYADRLRDAVRLDFKTYFEDARSKRTVSPVQDRMCLDALCDKFGLQGRDDWREFLRPEIANEVPGRLKHGTTITDNFDGADSTTIGNLLTWAEVLNNVQRLSNQVTTVTTGSRCSARAESDLASSDNESQIDVEAMDHTGSAVRNAQAASRYGASDESNYAMYYSANSSGAGSHETRLVKYSAGSATLLGTIGETLSIPVTLKSSSNGSTIKGYAGATEKFSVTDSSLTTGLRGGITCRSDVAALAQLALDDFQAADLAASGLLYTQLERGVRGLMRGTFAGST